MTEKNTEIYPADEDGIRDVSAARPEREDQHAAWELMGPEDRSDLIALSTVSGQVVPYLGLGGWAVGTYRLPDGSYLVVLGEVGDDECREVGGPARRVAGGGEIAIRCATRDRALRIRDALTGTPEDRPADWREQREAFLNRGIGSSLDAYLRRAHSETWTVVTSDENESPDSGKK